MNPLTLVVWAWSGCALLLAALWLLQRRQTNAGWMDIGWCVGLIGVLLLYALGAYGDPARRLLIAALVAGYALPLGLYLYKERVHRRSEDHRYQSLRIAWGARAPLYFFLLFQAQAAGIVLFSLPLLLLMQNPRPTFSLWELAGALVWLVAVLGETAANRQLARFRAAPANRGRTCREGLWRYSRHPNYFFEWLHWCAYVVMGVGVPGGLLTLLNPVIMLIFLLKISGVPLVEAQALATRGEDYRRYQRATSAFVPWFPDGESR